MPTIANAQAETLLIPDSEAELSELLRQHHAGGLPWTPSGLGTRLHWGAPLQQAGAVVSVRRLNGIVDHAVDDLTITVQAGLPLADLQQLLAEHGQWLPVDWPWGTSPALSATAGTVGGLVARGLSGSLRQRHMGVRDQLIGIGLLRSDGVAAHAGGRVVKNVAGYDLMRLLCGSWGSLALITEVTLRLQPMRTHRRQLRIRGDLPGLERLRAEVVGGPFTPDWIDWERTGCDDCCLHVGVASICDAAVNDQLDQIAQLADRQSLSSERLAWPQAVPDPVETGENPQTCWLLRLCLPPSRCAELFTSAECRQLDGWRWRLAAGLGSGEAWQTTGAVTTVSAVINLRRHVMALGGELSVLVQPPSLVADPGLPAWSDAPSKAVIAAVKRQFDPSLQLARGRLPGVAEPLA